MASKTNKQPTVTRQAALDKLQALVNDIPGLINQEPFSENFTKWRHLAKASLKHVFPGSPEYINDFDELQFSLMAFHADTPDSEFDRAFKSGLGSARAMLEARIEEVREFWPDREQAEENAALKPTNPDLVFVIHGRQMLEDFHTFLRALGLKPLEWSQARRLTGKPTPYTWEIVDTALRTAGAIVALLTTDDEARLREELWSNHENALEKGYLHQPRQNVLFEAGVAYGRAPDRTVLVRVGSHRPMSDLAGHHILQLDDAPQSRQAVADALGAAGCPVDLSGTDWFRAGSFSQI